jgi:hypothetical protein
MERETEFLNALAQVAAYRIERGALTLLDVAGEPVLMFGR